MRNLSEKTFAINLKECLLRAINERISSLEKKREFQSLERIQRLKVILEKTVADRSALHSFLKQWVDDDKKYLGSLGDIMILLSRQSKETEIDKIVKENEQLEFMLREKLVS